MSTGNEAGTSGTGGDKVGDEMGAGAMTGGKDKVGTLATKGGDDEACASRTPGDRKRGDVGKPGDE